MRTKLMAVAVLAALTTGTVSQAIARDDFQQRRDEWRRQQQQLERDQDRDRYRDRDHRRGVDRQNERDKEKAWYWQERDAKEKLGTYPRRDR